MTCNDQLRGVQIVTFGDLRDEAVPATHILECARPAAAGIAHPAIFHIPGGKPLGGKSGAKMAVVGEVILRTPVAAVKVDDYGKRTSGFRHPQFTELIWVGTVGQTSVRRWRRCSEN